jgi:hypothetical protein
MTTHLYFYIDFRSLKWWPRQKKIIHVYTHPALHVPTPHYIRTRPPAFRDDPCLQDDPRLPKRPPPSETRPPPGLKVRSPGQPGHGGAIARSVRDAGGMQER